MGWLIFKYFLSGDVVWLGIEICFFYLILLLVRLNFVYMVLVIDGKEVLIKVEVNYYNVSFYIEF